MVQRVFSFFVYVLLSQNFLLGAVTKAKGCLKSWWRLSSFHGYRLNAFSCRKQSITI